MAIFDTTVNLSAASNPFNQGELLRTTAEILAVIEDVAGDGQCPQGFEIFRSDEVLQNEHLHATYTFGSAIRYLMRIRPMDAVSLESDTKVLH